MEQALGAGERAVEHALVVAGALHDLDAIADLGGELLGLARDDAHGFAGAEQELDELGSDGSGGGGDDDHGASLSLG